jgi:hypothetical protein
MARFEIKKLGGGKHFKVKTFNRMIQSVYLIDSVAQPDVVSHHDQAGIFIVRSGYSARPGNSKFLSFEY